nr:uncharacterized protein LOC109169177 [Ipomoea batatas]
MSPHRPALSDGQSSSPPPSSAGGQPPSSPSIVGQSQPSSSAVRTGAPICRGSVADSSAENNSSQRQSQPHITVRFPRSAGKGPLRPRSTHQLSTSDSSEYSPLQPLQPLSDNAFSNLFYCAALSSFHRSLSVKRFICQKRIVISDFTAKTGLIGKLKSCQLFTSVVTIDQFVKPVVYEFYANLAPELVCHNRVYVRGRMFEFGPASINHYFWSTDSDDDFVEDMDQITAKLTGGAKTRWVAKDTIKAVDLTASFALLHKIACTNWMPTKHHSYVKRSMAVLLYKIDQGVKFNLGELLFQHILAARNGANNRKELILPNLIYGILVSQGFQKHDTEDYEAQSLPIKVDPRLLHGTHVDDLGAPDDSHHQTRSSSNGAIVETIHVVEEELAELVPNLFLPSSTPECDDGVITQPEKEVAAECENNCEADDKLIGDSDAEDSCDPFLSDDDDEVRAAMKFGTQQAEEDIDGAENSPNDEDIHGAENTDNEEGMQQNGGDNGGCEDMDQAAFGEDYDSDNPPSYHTDNEDNLNDVGDHSIVAGSVSLNAYSMAKQQGNDLGKNGLAANDVEGPRHQTVN